MQVLSLVAGELNKCKKSPSHSLPVLMQVAVCFVKALPVATQGQSGEYLWPCVSQFNLSQDTVLASAFIQNGSY